MKFLAAAVQIVASDDKAANLLEAERWVRAAASRGAQVVALPEVFIWRGSKQQERQFAEPIPGPTSTVMARLAEELRIHLLAAVRSAKNAMHLDLAGVFAHGERDLGDLRHVGAVTLRHPAGSHC